MKRLILLTTLFYSFLTFGQTASEHLEIGRLKQEKRDFKGAMKEFDRAIEIDSSFADAYYSRASILFDNAKFKEAILDLNKSISLNPKITKALILRGLSNVKTDNKELACEDFIKAKQLGDALADNFIQEYFCVSKVQKGENIVLDFPESENWKITYQSSENGQSIYLLGRSNETTNNWTELAGMSAIVGIKGVDLEIEMKELYNQERESSPKAKLTYIDKDLTSKYPWIMFTIESIYNEECKCYESKLCYLTQGQQSFYSCFRLVRGEKLTKNSLDKLKRFFLKTEIITE